MAQRIEWQWRDTGSGPGHHQKVLLPDGTPHLHEVVEDTATRRIGRVVDFIGGYVQLRPLGGGREWDAEARALRPVGGEEALSAGVAAANARSRGECP